MSSVIDPIGRAFERLVDYARLVRLHRPVGVWLLLWPALWALLVASHGHPHEHVLIVFALGALVTRSAGCAINDWADRHVDGRVQRTADRPLATGRIRPGEALAVYLVLSMAALGLVLTLDVQTILYALVGALLMAVYPFLKRFFAIPQLWLGIAFSWSVPMAWVAETGRVSTTGWIMFAASVAWVVVYDTMYAMVDRNDDLRIGVRSSAIAFGRHDVAVLCVLQVVTLALLAECGVLAGLGAWFECALVVGSVFFFYQYRLIRERDRDRCLRGFVNNQWFGLVVCLGILLDFAYPHG